jgi:hypothetical protein
MRQAARLTRTPLILATMTTIAGLVVSAVGGAASTSAAPAEVGMVLFQTFFSLAFAVVAWVGPGVSALTIVSERTSRTWEAIVLTGLSPRSIAVGKFLASLSYIGLYLTALAPVGALPFLFGGVTAVEVATAFVLIAVFGALSVGFGLAVSSGARSPSISLIVALPLAVAASMFTYFGLGMGLSFGAHALFPAVADGTPVWLPTAYARADFGREYFAYLVVVPATVTAILAGFFFEATVANLSDPSDDRTSGLKRWFLLSSLALVAMGLFLPMPAPSDRWIYSIAALGSSWLLSVFCLFVLAADPRAPSRRVRALWEREKAGPLRRFAGPGVGRTALLLVLTTTACQAVLAGGGVFYELHGGSGTKEHAESIALFAAYGTCFFGFLCGFLAFVRSRDGARFAPRASLSLAIFAAFAGPLFVVAILGVTAFSFETAAFIGAPSPLYVFAMIGDLESTMHHDAVHAGVIAMLAWAALGAVLALRGARNLGRIAQDAERERQRLDEQLDAEDASVLHAGPEEPSPA